MVESFALEQWWNEIPWLWLAFGAGLFSLGQLYTSLTNEFSDLRMYLAERKKFADITWEHFGKPYGKEIMFLLKVRKTANDVSCNLKVSLINGQRLMCLENYQIFGNERYLQSGFEKRVCDLRDDLIHVNNVAIGPSLQFGTPYSYRIVFELWSRGSKCSESVFIITKLKTGLFIAATMDAYLAEATDEQPSGFWIASDDWD